MSWIGKVIDGVTGGGYSNITKRFDNVFDFAKGAWDDFTGKSAIELQNKYNMQMWELQNQYNTPASQVQRWRDAGLNPSLIYSQGSSGNASSAPSMIAHQGSAAKLLELTKFVLTLKNMAAQNKNLGAQTGNINAQTAQHLVDVDYKMALLDFYDKHGYFPNQMNSPVNVARELINNSPVRTVTEGIGRWLGDVAGAAVGDFTSEKGYSGRAMDLAIKAADNKKLNGYERSNYIKKFVEIYNLYH